MIVLTVVIIHVEGKGLRGSKEVDTSKKTYTVGIPLLLASHGEPTIASVIVFHSSITPK